MLVGLLWRRETAEMIEQSRRVNDELIVTALRLARHVDQLRAELDRIALDRTERTSDEEDPGDG